ncbi:septal ring factor EnvC (AmiA/AmiB activator) [Microbacteriaceae bacterium SG_E_30_P1]|uniref:Septal ring factor EnvC (AmiA/AmiB activator) n=1 Tax=Antiquaquibacter oligotrophicus TaxID=2880260 RepID=A0ABT6KP73_9MICO|nr:hypothetical protein [Antiquaquibacter oligotrophicus]MDH6181806.1 septal ring factor EnvC (AmiA/AmiB activator) [Antiquaquibacter oligotrophicus]UDF12515.1 hypothetical protein LH407_10165 [Antiquaquibacter oligotrophicus]
MNWENIIVQAVASAGVISAALLPVLVSTRRKASSAAKDASAARSQVQNSHTKNFRDDHDDKHTAVMSAIARVESDIRGVRRDVGRLADADVRHEQRIHDLEQTQPRNPTDRSAQ